MKRTLLAALSLSALSLSGVALIGCAASPSNGGTVADPGSSRGPITPQTTSLTITVDDGPGTAAQVHTLTCDPAGGSHPRQAAACALLAAAKSPFAPVAKDIACTEIFGGPQRATVTGTFRGQPINASFSRTNGCEISRWEGLSILLGSAAKS